MATRVEILSHALVALGRPRILSEDTADDGVQALLLKYDLIKDKLLTSHPWSFARKTYDLVRTNNTPTDKSYQYEFNLPSDFLQLYKSSTQDYMIVENRIVNANETTLTWTYITDVNEDVFPSYFVDYFSMALADSCALLITKSESVAQSVQEKKIMLSLYAMNRDEANQPQRQFSSPFKEARYR